MMKVIQIPKDDLMTFESCVQCNRKIREGQWVLHCMTLDGSYTKRNMLAHVDCVRNAINDVPDVRGMLAHTTREELVQLRAAL